jgi:two-component system chemotaxis response regulator CheB
MKSRAKHHPIRVVVVDDSTTARELLVALLQTAEGIQVVGGAANGQEAVRLVKRLQPDVVTMDVVMPKMDGLEATRQIMREAPTPIVIVTATLMRDDIDLAFEALQAGALTALRKPGLADPETCQKIVQAVRLMADVPVVRRWGDRPRATSKQQRPAPPAGRIGQSLAQQKNWQHVQLIGIASSTGGPGALATAFKSLPADFPLPILVVQHVTRGFTTGLADWLNGETALQVGLAGHGETPRSGTILLAPDDYHMRVNGRGVVELSKEPPYKGLRPAANYLFHSMARAYGPRAMGIIMTGMGDDGAEGIEALHKSGGITIAQDEKSSVVYGMPREAVLRNAVDQVLSLNQIAAALDSLAKKVTRDG